MGSYYTYISRTGIQPKVIFSVPYQGYFGLGEHIWFLMIILKVISITQFRI